MKKKLIQIIIDGKRIKAEQGQTILEVAQENGIDILSLCYHTDLGAKAHCRLCLVEIKGVKGLKPSCSTKIESGMEITTNSPRIKKARRINLELILAQNSSPQLLELARKYKVDKNRFTSRKKDYPIYQFGPALFFDSSKCVDCRICFDICKKQGVDFLEIKQKKNFFQVVPSKDEKKDCIYCGQCVVHCPVAVMQALGEIKKIEKAIKDKNKIVVFQFAPSIRTSIGEEFNLPYGEIVTEKLVGAIKKLGVDRVFDTSVGADFTTVEEAKEMIEKLEKKNTPCLSSCCPAWVKFIEFYYPEFIPYLATTRSPQAILGGLVKTYFAEKEKINPKRIVVVSVMPCVAKKYEIQRKELDINGLKPVDYVLTTHELANLFKKHKIDLRKVALQKPDNPLGIPSGGGVIYGASGGVVESALRTVYEKLTKKKLAKIEFKQVRGMQEMKKAKIKINGKVVKIAVVNGIENAKKILEELKKNPKAYDAVEVMACFGGCIGGGGQPVPTDARVRQERANGLYAIDVRKEIRSAHQNPIVKKVYKDFLNSKEKINLICHTEYFHKRKEYEPNKNANH